MRVVLDSTTVIDGIFPRPVSADEHAAEVLDNVANGTLTLVWSRPIRSEYLAKVFALGLDAVGILPQEHLIRLALQHPALKRPMEKLMAVLSRGCEVSSSPVSTLPQVEDPRDQKFLIAAYHGDAHYIVTRDGHVNAIPRVRTACGGTCQPVSPWQLLLRIRDPGRFSP